MKIVNLDHLNTLPGGVGESHDRACVLSETETERHLLTGETQPKMLFIGTLAEAHRFARDHKEVEA